MKKLIVIAGLLATTFCFGQNKLLSADYWKAKPDTKTVQKDIEAGNSPSEFDGGQFDAVTLAINNDAPYETILYLLSQPGNSINKITHDGRNYLHWAAFRNRTDLVEYLIKEKSDLYLEDTAGRTPFDFGALGGMKIPIFDLFFKAGYPVNKVDADGVNALMTAAGRDNEKLETTYYLISKGINPKAKDKYGRTFVDHAARAGNVQTVQALIKKGFPYTDQALTMAALGIRNINSLPIFIYLVETAGIKANTIDKDGKNALHLLAGKENSEEQVAYLLKKGTRVDVTDKDGSTPLFYAVRNRNLKNIQAMSERVDMKSALQEANEMGQNLVLLAAQFSDANMLNYLMQQGGDIQKKDKKGNGILYYIVEGFSPRRKDAVEQIEEKVNLLNDNKFDFNAKNGDGNTFLHLAAEKDNEFIVDIALKFSRNAINEKNGQGNTPLITNAMVAKNTKVLKKMVQAGARKEVKNEFGETAFELASDNEVLQKSNEDLSFLK